MPRRRNRQRQRADFAWFDEVQLATLHRLHLDAKLHRELDRLMAALDGDLARRIAPNGWKLARKKAMRTMLDALNGKRCVGGRVPMERWLTRAQRLGKTRAFRPFLADLRSQLSFAPPPAAAPVADPGLLNQLECRIGDTDDSLELWRLQRAVDAARAVARLRVPRVFDGETETEKGETVYGFGTGWLVAPGLLLTNHHVVQVRHHGLWAEPPASADDLAAQIAGMLVDFDYTDERGRATRYRAVRAVALSAELDVALLEVAPENPRAAERPYLPLGKRALVRARSPWLDARVNVIQHPGGAPLRVAMRDNFVLAGDREVLTYLTDTEGGSSGSPVLDDEWTVVALHRGTRQLPADGPQPTLRGVQIAAENYGVPIQAILTWLQADARPQHDRIMRAQDRLAS